MKLLYKCEPPRSMNPNHHEFTDDDLVWQYHSMPIGNGYLGACVYGYEDDERIQITDNSFANPYKRVPSNRTRLTCGLTSFANIYLHFGHGSVEDYRRELDIERGVCTVSYKVGGVSHKREYFTSYPDNAMVIRLNASEAGALDFVLRPTIPYEQEYMNSPGDHGGKWGTVTSTVENGVGSITLSGTMEYFDIDFVGLYTVITDGTGTVTATTCTNKDGDTDGTITVSGAKSAYIIINLGTDYELTSETFINNNRTSKPTFNTDLAYAKTKVEGMKAKTLDTINGKSFEDGYSTLKTNHINDYSNLFGRVSLNLDFNERDISLTTDELLNEYKNGSGSSYLEALYFQYGRYLLIASSRSGGLPANLQGAWNRYNHAPWASGYWHNINVQMNYWPSGIANLAECFVPYIEYAKAYMPSATAHADEYIRKLHPDKADADGENGWAIGTAAFLYYVSSPAPGGHSGPGTGAFTSLLFWDYYTFTGDKEYLREVGYPFLREMSRFLSKTLIEVDGKLLVRDSASPEQQLADGSYYKTVGCAFDQQMIYENHKRVLEAAEILGIPDDELLALIRWQLPRLDPVQIGLDGQIKEFREEEHYGDIGEYTHRHISQLVGLYPATIINKNTPEWLGGAKISLTKRSDKSTGWAAAHRLCAWARTGVGNRAYDLYYSMLKNNTLPNLWDTHPPFQIDGNFGAVAGISEMLLQSQAGFIDFLPSLPDVWTDGSFDGLVARGDFVCGCDFAEKKPTEIRIHARSGGKCRVRLADIAGKEIPCAFTVISPDEVELQMAKDERVSIKI